MQSRVLSQGAKVRRGLSILGFAGSLGGGLYCPDVGADPLPGGVQPSIADGADEQDEDEDESSLSVELDTMSRYLWKGVVLSSGAASSLMVDVTTNGCSFGAGHVQPWLGGDGAPTPIEAYAYAQCTFKLPAGFEITPVAEYWGFPADGGWHAAYFAAEIAWTTGPFSVGTTQAAMVGDANGSYYGEFSLGYGQEWGPLEFEATAALGWGNSAFMRHIQEVEHTGLNQLEANAQLTWNTTEHLSLFASGYVVGLLDASLRESAGSSVLAMGRGGLRVSFGL